MQMDSDDDTIPFYNPPAPASEATASSDKGNATQSTESGAESS